MDTLEKILREEFKIEHDRYGVQSVTTRDDAYSHVILELNTFTLSDFEIKKLIEACNKTGYDFYLTPRGERESQARHYITFHK
jgi:hypothetical protein